MSKYTNNEKYFKQNKYSNIVK